MKESKKVDKYLHFDRELKKLWNITAIPIVIGMLGKKTSGIGIQRKNRDHPDYCIGKIGQNTEESPGDLRRLAITQTPVKDHQLMLVGKIQ